MSKKNGSDKDPHYPQAVAVDLWNSFGSLTGARIYKACREGDGIRLHPTSREVVIVDVIPKPDRLSSLVMSW